MERMKTYFLDILSIVKHKEGMKPPHRRSLRDMAVRNFRRDHDKRMQAVGRNFLVASFAYLILFLCLIATRTDFLGFSGPLGVALSMVAYFGGFFAIMSLPVLVLNAKHRRIADIRDYFLFVKISKKDSDSNGDIDGKNSRCHCGPDCRNRENGTCCRDSKRAQIELATDPKTGKLILDQRTGTSLLALLKREAREFGIEIASAANQAADRLAQAMFCGKMLLSGFGG